MSYQSEKDEELTEEEVNELMGLAETREDIVNKVFSDYQKVKREMIRQEQQWVQAKYPDNSVEQSYVNHIDNGVNFLLNLYRSLPENHFMVEEEFLREVVYLFVCHDFHKLRNSDYEDEFDMGVEEVEGLVEDIKLTNIHEEPDIEAIRGVIMSHHVTDERSCETSIPHGYLDEFNFVLLADAMASTESLESIKPENSNVRKRFDKSNQLDYDLSLRYHSVDRTPDEMTKLISKSVSDVLEERGYEVVKVYEDGCLYITDREEIEEDILDEVYERFIENFKTSNHKYSLRASESTNTELSSQNYRYYEQRYEDVLVKGLETVLKGVIKRAIEQSREGDHEATDKMKSKVDEIEDVIDIDILTKNRRVEYLASAIHSIRMYFVKEMDFYENDAIGFLDLFDIHTEEREQKVRELVDNHDGVMTSGTRKWYYKYIIAQYIYDDYFEGEAGRELVEKISQVLIENMGESFQECEERLVSDIKVEIKDYIARTVTIDGTKIGEMSSNIQKQASYNECEYCGYQTSANCDEGLKLSNDNAPQDFEMEVNVTGSGETEVINPSNEPSLCYVCQLETLMRQTTRDGLDEEDRVYVEIMGEYGFVPQEEWVFENIIDNQNREHYISINDGMSSQIVKGELPDCVDKAMRCGDNENFIGQNRGMEVSSSFGRGRTSLPVNLDDTVHLYEAVTVVAFSCAYSGTRAHISTTPVSRVDYSQNEVLVLDEEISKEIPFFETSNTLKDIKNIVNSVCILEVFSKKVGSNLNNGKSSHMRTIEKISNNFAAPASRLSRMYEESEETTIEIGQKPMIMADKEFSEKERYSDLVKLASTVSSLLPEKTRKETKNVISSCLSPYRNGDVDDRTWLVDELVDASTMPEGASEALAEEAAEKIESYFEGVEDNERLNKMGEEIIDTVMAYTRG